MDAWTKDSGSHAEITTTRVFNSPRAEIYAAFADPSRVARWWGPNGFTNSVEEFDLRVGGRWRITMRGPDGAAYPNVSEFVEVVPGRRVAYDHLDPVHRFLMTMTWEDADGGTRMTWRMRFASAEEFARVREFVIPATEENFDRLAAHLAGQL